MSLDIVILIPLKSFVWSSPRLEEICLISLEKHALQCSVAVISKNNLVTVTYLPQMLSAGLELKRP